MLELLGRFGRFLDEDDRCNPPVLLIPFPRLLGLVDCIAISKVWTTGMLVAREGPPDKRAGLPHQRSYSQLSLGTLHLTEAP